MAERGKMQTVVTQHQVKCAVTLLTVNLKRDILEYVILSIIEAADDSSEASHSPCNGIDDRHIPSRISITYPCLKVDTSGSIPSSLPRFNRKHT